MLSNYRGIMRYDSFHQEPGEILKNHSTFPYSTISTPNEEISTRYKYDDLRSESSIRLIKLLPPQSDEVTRCIMYQIDLDDCDHDPYVSLSYTWGRPVCSESIICNGMELMITPNLKSALKRLESKPEYSTIWIDAICINQGQDDSALYERSKQVQMMYRIFQSAEEVLIDLGEDDGELDMALRFASRLLETANDKDRNLRYPIEESEKVFDELTAWSSLITRPWFKRTWVIQEYAAARKSTMMIGTKLLESDMVMEASSHKPTNFVEAFPDFMERRHTEVKVKALHGMQALNSLSAFKFIQNFEKNPLLPVLLKESLGTRTTDPRDRFYALRGLMKFAEIELKVDYTENVTDLGRRIAIFLMKQDQGISALMIARGYCDNQPSWITALEESTINFESLAALPMRSAPYIQSIMKKSFPVSDYKIFQDPDIKIFDDSQLMTSAWIFDRIYVTIPKYVKQFRESSTSESFDSEKLLNMIHWLPNAMEIISTARENLDIFKPCTPTSFEFWITLIKGLDHNRNIPDQAFQKHVKAWLDCLTLAENLYQRGREYDNFTPMEHSFNKKYGEAISRFYQIQLQHLHKEAEPFLYAAETGSFHRIISVTKQGQLVNVPSQCQVGDEILFIKGAPWPFLMRNIQSNEYKLVGSVYMHGIMSGELHQAGKPRWKKIFIS